MFTRRSCGRLLKGFNFRTEQTRNLQVSIIGASTEIGSNLALLVKQNSKVTRLKLHGDDEKIKGIALELNLLPGGPLVSGFVGDNSLSSAVAFSDLIVMVNRISRKHGYSRSQMLETNGPIVHKLCKAVAERNPEAFLAISTNPINSIIPLASVILHKYNSYNPFKLFGITHIDTARSKSYVANALQANARHLKIPVIGGHSEESVVPLFSNLSPTFYTIDACQANMLTRLIRKSGSEVMTKKLGIDSSTIAMAWSVNEFVDKMVDAIRGEEVEVNCYTANPHFGTKFFSGPTKVGPFGTSGPCPHFNMSNYECTLLTEAVSAINKDIIDGEEYANTLI